MSDNGGNGERSDDREDRTDESTDRASDDVSLSIDATLALLSNFDRRCILSYLTDQSDGCATVDELVDYLVARKAERSGTRPSHDHVLTTLHHVHVPKLADAGVVEYDARSQEIRHRGNERLERWLGRVRDETGE